MAGTGQESGAAENAGFEDLSDSEFPDFSELGDIEELGSSLGNPRKEVDPQGPWKWKQEADAPTPMERFHLRCLWVSDLSTQSWCEQQMVYGKELPGFQSAEKAAVLDAGSSAHLARELELHDLVNIHTSTKEDAWAVKLLNVLTMVPILQSGGTIREFPVFGEIEGVFLVGVIDELHYTSKGELELVELKTRKRAMMPVEAQKEKDRFQVSLYKCIFDAMVRGQVTSASLVHHMKLSPEVLLGPQVHSHAQQGGFTVKSFRDLLELTFLSLNLSDLPVIDALKIEYSHQETDTVLGMEMVVFEEKQVRDKLRHHLGYWTGLREPQGVDVKEAWKCRMCDYAAICEWRQSGGMRTLSQEQRAKKMTK
ncbi:exonuclease V isoform X2 [Phascolarctos cinereus]|uniref:Exonuclease V n=1 Tax=Phascolarctos cinereus TaxID=38626 RepID=A0A6P5LZF0_PHACI|nr:exonuclease V isoform X2 [Phascolarctos cinereus]